MGKSEKMKGSGQSEFGSGNFEVGSGNGKGGRWKGESRGHRAKRIRKSECGSGNYGSDANSPIFKSLMYTLLLA